MCVYVQHWTLVEVVVMVMVVVAVKSIGQIVDDTQWSACFGGRVFLLLQFSRMRFQVVSCHVTPFKK